MHGEITLKRFKAELPGHVGFNEAGTITLDDEIEIPNLWQGGIEVRRKCAAVKWLIKPRTL